MEIWRISFLIFLLIGSGCTTEEESASTQAALEYKLDLATKEGRLWALIRANTIATHAFQVRLAQETGIAESGGCYDASGVSVQEIDGALASQEVLLGSDLEATLSWVNGGVEVNAVPSGLMEILSLPLALNPALPVNVFTDYLKETVDAPEYQLGSVANLYQTCLEVDRDGTLLWDLYHFYIALGLPVYVGQFGLPGEDSDFYAVGKKLEKSCCPSPFETDAAAWRIAGRKVWNWGQKKLHIRDRFAVAKEMLAELEGRSLLVRIKSLPPQKVAIVGHSFTMDSHWASPSSFAAIVDAVFELENPEVRTRQWFGGGLTASRAKRDFYEEVLAWAPDKVLFVVAIRNPDDETALKEMVAGLREVGAEVLAFDNIADPSEDLSLNVFDSDRRRELDLTAIEVGELLASSPEKDNFLCLDGIHMKEPYHRLMGMEWLKYLVGARKAEL